MRRTTRCRLDKLEARQRVVAARIAERRNEIAAVKQDLIDTRVGYDSHALAASSARS